jgi:hypothetical protein
MIRNRHRIFTSGPETGKTITRAAQCGRNGTHLLGGFAMRSVELAIARRLRRYYRDASRIVMTDHADVNAYLGL